MITFKHDPSINPRAKGTYCIVAENMTSQSQNIYDEKVLPGGTTEIDRTPNTLHAEKLAKQWRAKLRRRFKIHVRFEEE